MKCWQGIFGIYQMMEAERLICATQSLIISIGRIQRKHNTQQNVSLVFFVTFADYMDDKFSEIVLKSSEVFMRYGLKSVTMDDIAREIKVSKKTLYKYVKDKSDLLCNVMQGHCASDVIIMDEILDRKLNAVEEIIEIGRYVAGQLKMMHPSIHYDMEKYYPEVWDMFENHKAEYFYTCVAGNMARGIKEGLYRDNLNVEIMVKLYLSKIDLVFDATIFPPNKFNFVEVYMELLRYHIKGIASDMGVEYLRNEIKNENLNFYQ